MSNNDYLIIHTILKWRYVMTQFYTRDEIVNLFRISTSTLTLYMRDKHFPYFKFKGRVLFSKEHIEEFIKKYSQGISE